MSGPLRIIEVVLETWHPQSEAHDVGAQTWYTDSGGCRFCTCTAGRHQTEHGLLRLAINPSTVRSIVPLRIFMMPVAGYVLVNTFTEPKFPYVVRGTVESVLATLNADG